MLSRTGSARSRKSCCRHRWTSPRQKPDSPSMLTCRVSAKRIWKYELPQILFAETRHVSMDGESGFCLGEVHRCLQQDFRLRAEPVLESMVVGEPAGFKQLVGTMRDQVINLLSRLYKWLSKREASSRTRTRSHVSS